MDRWTAVEAGEFLRIIGPLQSRPGENGYPVYGIFADRRHLNTVDSVHGGLLMVLADQIIGFSIRDRIGNVSKATIQLDMHFEAAAAIGNLIEGSFEIVRATRSLVFARCALVSEGQVVATAQGIWKLRSGERPASS